MKKGILALAMALVLALPLGVQAADTDAKDPVVMLTGKLWLESAENEKVAFLYGIDMAIAVEQYIARESDKAIQKKGNRKTLSTLSAFEKGWTKAFTDVKRKDIVKQVDDWYAANGDKVDRPVMEVIWYECAEPRLKAQNTK